MKDFIGMIHIMPGFGILSCLIGAYLLFCCVRWGFSIMDFVTGILLVLLGVLIVLVHERKTTEQDDDYYELDINRNVVRRLKRDD